MSQLLIIFKRKKRLSDWNHFQDLMVSFEDKETRPFEDDEMKIKCQI